MSKKRTRRRTPQKRSSKPTPARMVEDMAARPPAASDDARETAAQHFSVALDALQAGDSDAAVGALHAALDADPRDIDSLTLYAELLSEKPAEFIAALQIVERVAREELGETTFSEDRGHFWGLVETRPYMRLKSRIAGLLQSHGDFDAAIGVFEDMLALNPNDNQGVRDPLLGLYLATGALDKADTLLREYEEDDSAVMCWGRLLWHLRSGETGQTADDALAAAQAANVFVAPLLLGALKPPEEMPSMYTRGGANEAVVALECLIDAWWYSPDTTPLEWLAEKVWL